MISSDGCERCHIEQRVFALRLKLSLAWRKMQSVTAVEGAASSKCEGALQREGEGGLCGNDVEIAVGAQYTD